MTIKEFGFSQNSNEPCVYKKDSGSAVVFQVLYVDDILLWFLSITIGQYVDYLGTFSMKDLGEAT